MNEDWLKTGEAKPGFYVDSISANQVPPLGGEGPEANSLLGDIAALARIIAGNQRRIRELTAAKKRYFP